MAWIELHDTLPDHHKTRKLAMRLGISVPQAVGHLVCFFTWTIRFKPGGVLRNLSSDDISVACHWEGNPDALVNALIEEGWLDKVGGRGRGLKVHDWDTYTKGYQKAKSDRERKRRARVRGRGADIPRTGAVDRTRPDQTGPDQTGEKKSAPDGAAARLEKAYQDGHPESKPTASTLRLLLNRARDAKIAGKDSTIRKYLESWIARAGAARVEEILMHPDARGLSVIEIQENFIAPKNNRESRIGKVNLEE